MDIVLEAALVEHKKKFIKLFKQIQTMQNIWFNIGCECGNYPYDDEGGCNMNLDDAFCYKTCHISCACHEMCSNDCGCANGEGFILVIVIMIVMMMIVIVIRKINK